MRVLPIFFGMEFLLLFTFFSFNIGEVSRRLYQGSWLTLPIPEDCPSNFWPIPGVASLSRPNTYHHNFGTLFRVLMRGSFSCGFFWLCFFPSPSPFHRTSDQPVPVTWLFFWPLGYFQQLTFFCILKWLKVGKLLLGLTTALLIIPLCKWILHLKRN